MGRHSKHNTALGHFTYAEYQMTQDQWGSKKLRLGKESMRGFDCCSICLSGAVDPVCCSEGHLFCRECILTYLVTQKQEIAKQKAYLERLEREEEEERLRSREEARRRVLEDFEKSYKGLGGAFSSTGRGGSEDDVEQIRGTKRKASPTPTSSSSSNGTRWTLSDLPQRAEKLAMEAEEAAMKKIKAEQAESRKAKLPAFWLPSLTPSEVEGPARNLADKLKTLCKVDSEKGHKISSKSLTPVKFVMASIGRSGEKEGEEEGRQIKVCPGCKKGLTDSSLMYVSRPCSHVVCSRCVESLIKRSEAPACVECDTPLKLSKEKRSSSEQKDSDHGSEKDRNGGGGGERIKEGELIRLVREGTGYAAGGTSEARKAGTAFQG
ncbi:hypothetical protein IE53DRAFT_386689 [Violaceomyces palustris]|uniref:Uncharacterized protein n=1 Tax=Violaceomyces palustris TaxID=1673888 RepID=A0ACD0NYQ3_9BASI|nr:hypothetical protein IE53DRAFT_386689 [Violaceomyces palustris]